MLLPLLRAIVAIAGLCLMAATGPLWFGDSGFPVIPFFRILTGVPLWVDSGLSALLATALLLLGTSVLTRDPAGQRRMIRPVRLACALIVLSGASLVLLNQHRLQPWLYHLMLLCPVLALDEWSCWKPAAADAPRTLTCLKTLIPPGSPLRGFGTPGCLVILLTASIYFWSGLSKCDRSFIDGHGQTFVAAIFQVLGLSLTFWSPAMRSAAAAVLPGAEMLIAVGLLFPRLRRCALAASLLMHGLLIAAVGPWGMDQRPGVLIWNLLFIGQNLLLLQWPRLAAPAESATGRPASIGQSGLMSGRRFALGVIVLAAMAPALRLAGRFDNWPSWAVYTAGNEHAYVLIAEDALERLPPGIRRFTQPRSMNDGWAWLRIDLWSIAAVDAPVYPQQRFAVACGLAVARQPGMQDSVRILTESAADVLTGERAAESFAGRHGLQQIAARFTLNVLARETRATGGESEQNIPGTAMSGSERTRSVRNHAADPAHAVTAVLQQEE